MDRHPHTPSGFSMSMLIDEDIAHIGRVMPASMHGDFGGAILPAAYWRKRLFALLGRDHLSKPQLCAIDTLLLQLEHLDSSELEPLPFFSNPAKNPAHNAAHDVANTPAADTTPTAAHPSVRRATRAGRPRRAH
ncbi:hypothetical protein KZJ38_15210 [Paraburkholderia edwinii]|uniref:Uncharacterized protein n=1 Tax=Paraburkholderia edwinii TaxID=2861782 RepID=A0ABX8UFX6_9BURK|nr:hypothetical protein [Paraburkholderia edwinii]QYD67679.1 hypothetical protein KZJ38_15210 [Paraburkholderia edwinii]